MKIPIDLAITALQKMRDTVHQEECHHAEIPFMCIEDDKMRVFIFSFERGRVKTANGKDKEDWFLTGLYEKK